MATTGYQLLPNEAIIMRNERVLHGGAMANFTDELILTNQNIVLISKNFFGKVKNIQAFPVNQIRMYNDQAQVMLSKRQNGDSQIEVYFNNSQENFGFESKEDAVNWINKINQLVSGEDVEIHSSPKTATEKMGAIAGALGSTLNAFKGALEAPVETNEKVAIKCVSCGASISGKKGKVVRCPYCDSDQNL